MDTSALWAQCKSKVLAYVVQVYRQSFLCTRKGGTDIVIRPVVDFLQLINPPRHCHPALISFGTRQKLPILVILA